MPSAGSAIGKGDGQKAPGLKDGDPDIALLKDAIFGQQALPEPGSRRVRA